ncbi:hypothetical protein BSKO_04624 [Bryopsis sp. KO-2023]|nr:hypothetical protein BSKO_04624 [Bryopsis sp. KO-2023]
MVAPQCLALVIRQRGGGNLIVHTRGIPGNVAGKACEEAVTVMGKFAAAKGRGDAVTGDIPPTFGFDKLVVAQGRYVVVYRLVNKVWVMAVSPADGNLFVSIRVVESATKGLVTACQTMDIHAETVRKHYAETYVMMGAVLAYQGSSFGKAQVEGLANYYALGMDPKALKKAKSAGKKAGESAPVRRKLAPVSALKQQMTFSMPGKANEKEEPVSFPPRSPRIPVATRSAAPTAPVDDDLDFGKYLEDLGKQRQIDASRNQVQDPFIDVPGLIPESSAPPELFPMAFQEAAQPSADLGSFLTQQPTPAAPAHPPLPLLLIENWTAEFAGSNLARSRIIGEVASCPKSSPPPNRKVKFQLKQPEGCDVGLESSLRSALLSRGVHGGGGKGVFEADVSSDGALLKYKLWPGSFETPVMFRLTSGVQSVAGKFKGKEGVVVMLVEYAASSELKGTCSGFVDIEIPSRLGTPASARPQPQWSAKQQRLRWPLSISAGSKGVMRVIFPPASGLDSLSALGATKPEYDSAGIEAEVNLIGALGNGLSGVSLLQQEAGAEMAEIESTCVWRASIKLRE